MTIATPNILWLVSEDNSPEYVGPYGSSLARTPTIDALARNGIVYDNCYATAPVCAPSRFSIITGMYASSHAPAYQMRAFGNVSSPADCMNEKSNDLPVSDLDPTVQKLLRTLTQGSCNRYLENLPKWLRGFPAYLREAGYYCTNNAKEDYNAPIDTEDAWDESSSSAHWRNRPNGAPFFAVFNYETTHASSLHPGRFEPLPDGVDPNTVRLPAYHPDIPEMRYERALYYDQNTRLDIELAERLTELESDQLTEDTIVFFYGDHGGSTPRSKYFCYDSGLRVPLVVYVPERWRHLWPVEPANHVSEIVSLLDLAPTMLSLTGVAKPQYMQGRAFAGRSVEAAPRYAFGFRNRMDDRYDLVRTVRDERYRYIRNYMPHLPYGQHIGYLFLQESAVAWQREYEEGRLNTIQTAFWEEKPFEELYDLANDPDEVTNLATQPEHQSTLDRMRTALDGYILRTRDNGFLPEGSPLQGIEQTADSNAYPLEHLLHLSSIAAQRNVDNLPQLIEALTAAIEPVRYWGALGCVMLRRNASPARQALTELLAHEPTPTVQIAVAEALCWLGDTDRGLSVLEDHSLNHEYPCIRHQALSAIESLGDIAQPVHYAFAKARNDASITVAGVAYHATGENIWNKINVALAKIRELANQVK